MLRTGIPAREWMEDWAMMQTVIGLLSEEQSRGVLEPGPGVREMGRGTL